MCNTWSENMKQHRYHWGAFALIGVFLLTLIPVVVLGFYAHPSLDDFCYGIKVYFAIQNDTSIFVALWETLVSYYMSWQGSYSAMAMMTFMPFSFSFDAYWLTPVFMVVSISIGTIKLMDTLVRRWLGGTWVQVTCLWVPILLLSIQTVASPVNSFYWWNGAVYYTFTYGIMLLLVERWIALCLSKSRKETLWAVIPGIVAAIFVGGSNYVSALLAAVLGVILLAGLAWRNRKKLPYAALIFVALMVAFGVSILSPGNQVRQSANTITPPLYAIYRSILAGGKDVLTYMTPLVIVAFLLLLPVLYRIVKGMNFTFPMPFLFSVFTFLVFCTQNAPHLYAASTVGPDRLRNIVFFSIFWLFLVNEIYWLGWLVGHFDDIIAKVLKKTWNIVFGAVAAVLVVLVAFQWSTFTSTQAVDTLTSGSAQTYKEEWDARMELLMDEEFTDVVLTPSQEKPALLYMGDATTDSGNWSNQAVANYFSKNTVIVE